MDFNSFYSPGANFSDGRCAGGKDTITNWVQWQHAGLGQDIHSALGPATGMGFGAILAKGRSLVFPAVAGVSGKN